MKQTMQEMDRENTVMPASSDYTKRLNRLTKGMTSVGKVKLNFKVYKSNEANAFASPDGSVRVYTKLMDIMSDNELLGVIGHELGHIAHSDSKRAFQEALIASAVRDGLMTSDGTIGAIARSTLGDIGETLVNAKFSRKQEAAADDYGYDFLKKHGKNPWAMAMAFEKLKAMENDKSGKYMRYAKELLSSHPDLDNRIKTMSERARKDRYTRPKS
ncbi:MAG: M48 family metalloprotease [Muribaculaceae bacterium]|nr:M48 family metalloprotease [Muribaculaceae bacterium]